MRNPEGNRGLYGRQNKRVSTRIRKMLLEQNNECACGASIDGSTYFETDKGLKCGTCVLKAQSSR